MNPDHLASDTARLPTLLDSLPTLGILSEQPILQSCPHRQWLSPSASLSPSATRFHQFPSSEFQLSPLFSLPLPHLAQRPPSSSWSLRDRPHTHKHTHTHTPREPVTCPLSSLQCSPLPAPHLRVPVALNAAWSCKSCVAAPWCLCPCPAPRLG